MLHTAYLLTFTSKDKDYKVVIRGETFWDAIQNYRLPRSTDTLLFALQNNRIQHLSVIDSWDGKSIHEAERIERVNRIGSHCVRAVKIGLLALAVAFLVTKLWIGFLILAVFAGSLNWTYDGRWLPAARTIKSAPQPMSTYNLIGLQNDNRK